MTDRELMQQALYYMDDGCGKYSDDYRKLIDALRARLTQPEPLPAKSKGALSHEENKQHNKKILDKFYEDNAHLYTAPPQREWQTLTENEIKHLWYEACQTNLELTSQLIVHLARNIEAKLKEKNT